MATGIPGQPLPSSTPDSIRGKIEASNKVMRDVAKAQGWEQPEPSESYTPGGTTEGNPKDLRDMAVKLGYASGAPGKSAPAAGGGPPSPASVAREIEKSKQALQEAAVNAGLQPAPAKSAASGPPPSPAVAQYIEKGKRALQEAAVKGGLQAAAPAPAGEDSFEGMVRGNFDAWDGDKNGQISEAEINKVIRDKNVRGKDAAAAAALKREMSGLEDLSNDEVGPENDGVSQDDLDAFSRHKVLGDKHDADYWYNNAKGKIANQSRDLFPSSPDPRAVTQGAANDCWVMAAASGLAAQRPDDLKKMIQQNPDGTYNVKVDGKDVRVDAPTDGEIGLYGTAGKNGLWLPVLEKAFAKSHLEQQPLIKQWPVVKGEKLPQDQILGDTGSHGIEVLTGSDTDSDVTAFSRASATRGKLETAMQEKQVVVAGIKGELFGDGHEDDTGLKAGHEYTVLGYDPATDMVTVRNPWGHGERTDKPDGKDDGVFTMTVGEFDDAFTFVTFEE